MISKRWPQQQSSQELMIHYCHRLTAETEQRRCPSRPRRSFSPRDRLGRRRSNGSKENNPAPIAPKLMKKKRAVAALIAGMLCSCIQILMAAAPSSPTWPQFRGPNASGVADQGRPPINFGPGTNLADAADEVLRLLGHNKPPVDEPAE